MQDPNTIDKVPRPELDLTDSRNYWIYVGHAVYHNGWTSKEYFHEGSLKEGSSIGCCITRRGDFEIYINGKKGLVGWRNVPVNKPLWGVVITNGQALTIQSEFYCGELYSYNVYSVSHTYDTFSNK